jgi:hypothetical protein
MFLSAAAKFQADMAWLAQGRRQATPKTHFSGTTSRLINF